MSLASGTRLGPYEIGSLIGQGGMGEVYRARDTKLDREVAIKVLPEEFAKDEERLARFEREAKLLASLNHPNIASIYGFESGALVLELVEGPTLAEKLQEGPIPVEDTLAIAKQIAEALEAGHESGVIHRDLKPANVKVKEDGTVKVLDYGLAKALLGDTPSGTDAELSQSPTLMRHGTQVGVILGTAAYMSPEQAKGKRVDKRADIWAFGALVYEMLTGRQAFSGEDFSETLAAILKEEPDWTRLPAETPAKLDELLRRCLRKDPKRRLHDVADARIEIEEGLGEAGVEAPPPRRTGWAGRAAVVLAAVAASVVTGVAFTAFILMRPTASPAPLPVTRSVIPLPTGGRLGCCFESMLAISPDGRTVAYVVQEGNARQLYLRSLDSMEAKLLPGTDTATMPFFSPDARWVGFIAAPQYSLKKVSVTGGAPVELSPGAARGATWAPDGSIIFTRDGVGLERVSSEGGASEILTTPDFENREKTHRFPKALPGGKAVLFTNASADIDSFDEASIGLLSLETGERRILIQGGSYPHYVSSGHLVYGRAGAIVAVPFDLDGLEVTGPPVTVLEGVSMDPIAGNAEMSISETGHLLYAPGGSFTPAPRVVWVDRAGNTEPLTRSTGRYGDARLAPDDSRLAMRVGGANNSIWIYDIARATATRLVSGFENMNPVWTPSGDRVTFHSNRSGTFNLYWQVADGSAPLQRLTTSELHQSPESWSPDGQWLAFMEGGDIWAMSIDGDRMPRPVVQSADTARFSPDGRFLAYVSEETGRREVYVQAFPTSGRKWQVSTGGGERPVWHPTGRELFYANGSEILVVEIGSEDELSLPIPRRLLEVPSVLRGPMDISSDGERFVFIDRGDDAPAPTHLVLVQNWAEELKRLAPADP